MADQKLTALTAEANPASTDIFYIVDDPGGTPASKKVTGANMITKAHGMSDGVAVVSGGVMSGDSTPDIGTPSAGVLTNCTGYPGDASLVTTGTITTGVWNAGAVTSSGAISGTTLTATATGSLTLGTASTATGQITLKNSTNANDVIIQPGASAASVTYTWPTNVGGAGEVLTDAAGNGVLSWASAGGGGSPGGADTQFQYNNGGAFGGISSWAYNDSADTVAITGTGTTTTDFDLTSAVTTGTALKITASSATSTSNGSALWVYSNSANASARNLVFIENDSASADSCIALKIQQDGDTAAIFAQGIPAAGAGIIQVFSAAQTISSGRMFLSDYDAAGSSADKTGDMNRFNAERVYVLTATRNDDYDAVSIFRENLVNNASGTFNATGSVLKIENSGVQTLGTLNDTVTPLEVVNDVLTSTNFTRMASFGGITIWTSDGTTPNGNLSGTAGDICFNGASSQPFYCTGTTNWTGM